jgi:hypothetical protein
VILNPGDIAIDYSSARPDPAAIVAAGVRLVVRYMSPRRTNPKNITAAERDALLAAGLSILLVWEAVTTDPLQGAPLGAIHGIQAGAFALDLGYPADLPIIVAVDFGVSSAQMPAVLAYLGAFQAASGYPQGAYGSDTLVTAAYNAVVSTLGWQTRAWSQGRLSPHADVRQEIGFVHPAVAALGSVDDNTVLRPFTAWSTSMPSPTEPTKGSSMQHVEDADTGDFWVIGLDGTGRMYARPVKECPQPDYWALYGPVFDAIGQPLPKVPHALLQAMYDRQGKPTMPDPVEGFHPHVHAVVGMPTTTGGVVP